MKLQSNMKLTEDQYLDLQQATKLSKPTIYKALNGHDVLKVTEYVVKLAYLESLESQIDRDWIHNKIYELDLMIEQL